MKRPAVCVVLVEPQGERNIGSVARAMMNFSVNELRLVNPVADYLALEAKHMAVRAAPLLEQADRFDDLGAAVADCHLVFGTTRRHGKYRQDCLLPSEVAELAAKQPAETRIAFVFGREDSGLSTAELDFCQHLLTIPSSENLPSLNLSHAVSICLYEYFCARPENALPQSAKLSLASARETESMFEHMRRCLLDVDYADPQNPDHILRTFRRIFGRAGLSERDVRILQGLWSRIDWLDGERKKKGDGQNCLQGFRPNHKTDQP